MENIDITELFQYFNIVIWGICICVSYVLKHSFKKFPKRLIPCIMLILGGFLGVIFYGNISLENIFSGMFSGILSTVSLEILVNIRNKKNTK